MDIETRLWINGKYVEAKSGETFTLLNPATEEKVAEVHIAGAQDVDDAVAAASAALHHWQGSPELRVECMNKLADLLIQHGTEIARLDTIAMGRPLAGQAFDVQFAASILRNEAALVSTLVGTSSVQSDGTLAMQWYQPYGVCAAIAPWNVPILMSVMKIGAACSAGNTLIFKSSEKAPLSSLYLAKLSKEAGFPDGVLNVVSGMGPTGQLLSEHMQIRRISFTGSTRTGRLVMQAAAKSNLKDVGLELGGKSPAIIFDDADLAKAVPACTFSIQYNSGQICMANSRILVQEGIKDQFLEQFSKAFGTYKHGDPMDKETTLGPQADAIQRDIVQSYLDIGNKESQAVIGGKKVEGKGHFFEPTIYTGIAENSRLNKEEVFGPVVVVHTFKDEAEALKRANDTEYGLYASVFTKDIDRALRVAKGLHAGTVGINATSPTRDHSVSFGGHKTSGVGREGGIDSLKRWCEEKAVIVKYDA